MKRTQLSFWKELLLLPRYQSFLLALGRRRLLMFFCFSLLFASLQAQISISADQNSGCAPFVVEFTATAPNATSYQWDLGNGSFSNLPNPGTTYLQGGNYDVSLTVG
ncbi:MAG: PKD domain-containing protein, partial [Bacteroidota bacterium]